MDEKRKTLLEPQLSGQSYKLPPALDADVKASLEEWRDQEKVRRLWAGDKTLWTNEDEDCWLGWLGVAGSQLDHLDRLTAIAAEVKAAGFADVLLLGMGGSSLCPEVMKMTFGKMPGFPELHVLDSTDPAQVRTVESKVNLAKTLFIVSSKSGGTLEPNIFKQYFFERVKELVGAEAAGGRFCAITDPGSKMQRIGEQEGFRHIFFGLPSIGGRYSALSDFGMIPAAIMGIDIARFLEHADRMAHGCASNVPPAENPGVLLGTVLGVLANQGRDKVTIITSPQIWDFGAWLEQLLAESTGKAGKGLIPVDQERLAPPEVYDMDRLFVYIRLHSGPDREQDAAIDALEEAGQPVVRISVAEIYALGQEFFRWEVATAVVGAIMGINPFNQPDVEASKIATMKLTSEYEERGFLPQETPIFEDEGIGLYADPRNATALEQRLSGGRKLSSYVKAHLGRIQSQDYFCISAYIEMNDNHHGLLQSIRHVVRHAKKVATCLGYGPRFLHSTGQAYKGGPNSGVFLQITCDDANDVSVPGQKYSFGIVKAAQARGDLEVLTERGRRVLRLHLGSDVERGLATVKAAVEQALA